MKPGTLDLPIIWRGCIYPDIQIEWTDQDGHPIDLTGWTPRAYSRYFQFTALVTSPKQGMTTLSLKIPTTRSLKLGVTNWDFIWSQDDLPHTISGPALKGKVEVREPVTDTQAALVARIGGGSNYIKMFPETQLGYRFMNLIGLYNRTWPQPSPPSPPYNPPVPDPVPVAPVIREQLAQMIKNGQTKITIDIYFLHAYLDVRDPNKRVQQQYANGLDLIPFNPSGIEGDVNVTLTDQQTQNLVNLIFDIRSAGFKQLNVRFLPGGSANNINWTDLGGNHIWMQDRYLHNKNYILSIIRIVQPNRGKLHVIYDLGAEHANVRLENNGDPSNNVHRQYCRFLWAAHYNEFGLHNSMAYSCVTQWFQPLYGRVPQGFVYMLDLFAKHNLPFPGYYGVDTYATDDVTPPCSNPVYAVLVETHDWFKTNYQGEELKPFIVQETFYNDGNVAHQIEQALNDRPTLNLNGFFQWPTIRGHDGTDYFFPDGYPKNFTNYRTI